mmetsp:Transcript_20044/g.55788  ORF Transcript_20044/g.55788 Transcript_20044/m.55788 type:complete len:233 (-) Transcript_20044:389-1087(-)
MQASSSSYCLFRASSSAAFLSSYSSASFSCSGLGLLNLRCSCFACFSKALRSFAALACASCCAAMRSRISALRLSSAASWSARFLAMAASSISCCRFWRAASLRAFSCAQSLRFCRSSSLGPKIEMGSLGRTSNPLCPHCSLPGLCPRLTRPLAGPGEACPLEPLLVGTLISPDGLFAPRPLSRTLGLGRLAWLGWLESDLSSGAPLRWEGGVGGALWECCWSGCESSLPTL